MASEYMVQPLTNGQPPPVVTDPYSLAGFLNRNIGRTALVQFVPGTTGASYDRNGRIMAVGADFIVLQEIPSGLEIIGDLSWVRFVTIYPPNTQGTV